MERKALGQHIKECRAKAESERRREEMRREISKNLDNFHERMAAMKDSWNGLTDDARKKSEAAYHRLEPKMKDLDSRYDRWVESADGKWEDTQSWFKSEFKSLKSDFKEWLD